MTTERTITIRPATAEDAPFLAWVMQEADRGHLGRGTWDMVFDQGEEQRLRILAELATAPFETYVSYSLFLVAEVDGRPAGALSGYDPDVHTDAALRKALRHVLARHASLSTEETLERLAYGSATFFKVPLPAATVRVEWVCTKPEYRGLGVIGRLHERLFERVRQRGVATAHVATYLGNDAAIAAYRKAGFRTYAEVRHADFEALYGSPGIVYFRRDL